MQYKTTIEVCTEAEDSYEAADIAGEFLKGDISSGAEVKIKTVSLTQHRATKTAAILCSVLAISGACMLGNQAYYRMASAENKQVTSYAIQPPLNTNLAGKQGEEFKKTWLEERAERIDSKLR